MPENPSPEPTPSSEIILYQTEDGRNRVEVRLENESVWLTQQLMAVLFQTTQQNVSLHIRNIYEEGELAPAATHKEFLSVRHEGGRQVRRSLDYYNLDLIIAIDLQTPPVPSASGKTLVVASTRGNQVTDLIIEGQPVVIGVNAYIKKTA